MITVRTLLIIKKSSNSSQTFVVSNENYLRIDLNAFFLVLTLEPIYSLEEKRNQKTNPILHVVRSTYDKMKIKLFTPKQTFRASLSRKKRNEKQNSPVGGIWTWSVIYDQEKVYNATTQQRKDKKALQSSSNLVIT